MDPIQWLMQLMGGGAGGPMPMGLGEMEMPIQPSTPPPPPAMRPTIQPPAPPPPMMSQMFPGAGGGIQRQSPGPAPGQSVAPPLPMPKPMLPGMAAPAAAGGSPIPQALAALRHIQAPEDENRGPPQPPAAPSRPAVDPGMLFEALMRLGVHPGQFPGLTQNLRI